ncbi:tetratricopeptide repeat protein [Streptomyces dysideae]|uniref:tetratricopeptide repeat protein n=1 Tax=Streptomyces dysideae TaxID=909626 RepID=UPI000832B9C1|nr:tetratricopeptide repeat protein [Streptomyces dysideae]
MSDLSDRRLATDASVKASGRSSVAAGGSIGQAITGSGSVGLHIDSATLLSPEACPPAASVDCAPTLTNLPSRAPLFVGRERELALLDEALATPGQAVVQAVHGLGGIGKSTLAARWAAHRGSVHAPVWWITADSRAAMDAGLAGLAAALQPSLVALLSQEQLTEWALQWLSSHTGWLLVLDNVSNPADVNQILARATSGRVLITSRRSTGWHGQAEPIELDVLSLTEAMDLFIRIHREDSDGAQGIAELCEELGCLPLAVAQAAAYCAQTSCTAREYVDDLAAYPADMYAAADESGDTERTIARVWHLTLDRLADDPLAVHILLMLAWYAPEGIPRTLLDSLGTPPTVRRALGRLAAHSMITLHDDKVAVHRLVQAVSRTPAEGDRHRHADAIEAARVSAVEALARVLPEGDLWDLATWPTTRRLLPHAEALAEHASPQTDTEMAATVFHWAAVHLLESGVRAAERALGLLLRAEAAYVRLFGADAPETLAVRVELPNAWRRSGDIERAEGITETVHDDCVRVLGEDHYLTLTALMRVAKAANSRGDVEQAGRLMEEVVEGRARILGDTHPGTLLARDGVAMNLLTRGDIAAAHLMLEELFELCVSSLGPEHPVTLEIQSHLLTVLPMSKILDGPVGEFLQDLSLHASESAALDVMMPRLMAAARHAYTQAGTGPETDVQVAERYVVTCRRVFGDDHLTTLSARVVLVQAYGQTLDSRRLSTAVEVLRADAVRALGPEHWFMIRLNGLLSAFDLMVEATRQVESLRPTLAAALGGEATDVGEFGNAMQGILMNFAGALQESVSAAQMESPTNLPFVDTMHKMAKVIAAMAMQRDVAETDADGGDVTANDGV